MKLRNVYAVPLAALAMAVAAQPAMAEKGDWFMHLRGIQIAPDEDPKEIDITNKLAPDLSIGYFMTQHFALDLLLTIPQKHEVRDWNSQERLGDFKQLPPTLFGQWHFNPDGKWRPYIGAGVNYTTFFSEKLYGPLEGAKLSLDDSWGLAGEIGADFMLNETWFLNVSVRFIDINSDAKVNGDPLGQVAIDPWVYGGHVGLRF